MACVDGVCGLVRDEERTSGGRLVICVVMEEERETKKREREREREVHARGSRRWRRLLNERRTIYRARGWQGVRWLIGYVAAAMWVRSYGGDGGCLSAMSCVVRLYTLSWCSSRRLSDAVREDRLAVFVAAFAQLYRSAHC